MSEERARYAAGIYQRSSEGRINQLLDDATVSDWLKQSLVSACGRDINDALRDAEILLELMQARHDEAVL